MRCHIFYFIRNDLESAIFLYFDVEVKYISKILKDELEFFCLSFLYMANSNTQQLLVVISCAEVPQI